MLLLYPVPRSTFLLHYLLGTGFSSLIKYHRWGITQVVILLSLIITIVTCLVDMSCGRRLFILVALWKNPITMVHSRSR